MAKIDYETLKSGLSDKDFARINEVLEKQDVFSKSSRKGWIAKIWIPRLVKFICGCMIIFTLFVGYSLWHHHNKPTPLILIEYNDGSITCAKPFSIEDGKKFYNFSQRQEEICVSLKKYIQ